MTPTQAAYAEQFWEVMEEMTPKERSLFVRFVCGLSRLPRSVSGIGKKLKIVAEPGNDTAYVLYFGICLMFHAVDCLLL